MEDSKQETARKVQLSTKVRIRFSESGEERDVQEVSMDIYSVMDAVLAKIATTTSKEELERWRVSVHSFEDTANSEPVPDGEQPYEGRYSLAQDGIEDAPLQDAVSTLAGLVIPADYALKNMERLCTQFFLRTRMDGCVFVVSSDGSGMSTTLVNSLMDFNPKSIGALYRTLLKAAYELRDSTERQFPNVAGQVDWDGDKDRPSDKDAGLVLPSGLPASMREQGVKTPDEIRAAGPRVLRLY